MNEQILYLIASLRDGSIDNRNCKNYEIKIGQKDQRWLSDVIKPIIENNFGVRVNIHKNLLRLTNKKAVREIQSISGIKPFGWDTPKVVKETPLEKRHHWKKESLIYVGSGTLKVDSQRNQNHATKQNRFTYHFTRNKKNLWSSLEIPL